MARQFQTIQQVEDFWYGQDSEITQADAPFLTSTTAALNKVYGAKVWAQLNQTANTWGFLPKYPYRNGGFRVLTARAASAGGGIAEAANVPETIKPTFALVAPAQKEVTHTFEISFKLDAITASEDDAIGFDELQSQMATHHAEMLNKMLWTDNDTLAGNNIESIDRIVGSYSEIDGGSQTAGDLDIYGLDRDASASWADAFVDHASADRDLTDAIVRGLIENTVENGAYAQGQVWVTGTDTWSRITGLYQSQVRYNPIGEATVQPSVNGIQTQEGANFGVQVATLYYRPVVVDKDVPKDTISRLYLLDISDPTSSGRPRLGIQVLTPTMYFETKSPFEAGRFTRIGAYYTAAETICTFFAAQGKARDLK